MSAVLDLEYALEIGLVVSSKPNAPGLLKAKRRGIPTYIFENNDWDDLHFRLKQCLIDYIFLAGFMKIVPANFVQMWESKIFNIHPSLLPSYPGLHSIERAYADEAPLGITIHKVVSEVDAGEAILKRNVTSGPTLESSELLVHIEEHRAVRKAFEWHKKKK